MPRTKGLREAYGTGLKIIGVVLSGGFLISELRRIGKLPYSPINNMYLVLLSATTLLVAGWVVYSKKDLDALSSWLDPVGYEPPEELLTIGAIAVALAVLLLAARNALLFGVVYVLYTGSNLIISRHMIREVATAIQGSRKWLEEDRRRPQLASQVAIYDKALDSLEYFFLRRPNLIRIAVSFCMAALGLGLAAWGRIARREGLEIAAYVIYIFSVVGVETAVMIWWRHALYRALRPLSAARYELLRRHPAAPSAHPS